jgi:hypothetical protein
MWPLKTRYVAEKELMACSAFSASCWCLKLLMHVVKKRVKSEYDIDAGAVSQSMREGVPICSRK